MLTRSSADPAIAVPPPFLPAEEPRGFLNAREILRGLVSRFAGGERSPASNEINLGAYSEIEATFPLVWGFELVTADVEDRTDVEDLLQFRPRPRTQQYLTLSVQQVELPPVSWDI